MRTVKVTMIVIVSALLINWVREGAAFPLPQTLPFLGGYRPGIYDAGACGLLLICAWGLLRLWNSVREGDDDPAATPSATQTYDTVVDDEDIVDDDDN